MKPWNDMSPRERDALVAERVMGLTPPFQDYGTYGYSIDTRTLLLTKALPRYTTDISAAWEVVEKLQQTFSKKELSIEISGSSDYPGEWEVSLSWHENYEDGQHGPFYFCAPTAPEAICLAALKAVGVDLK